MEARKAGYKKKRGSGLYLGAIDSIAQTAGITKVVQSKKGFWQKVETLKRVMSTNNQHHQQELADRDRKIREQHTKIEDLTRQLEHVAKDRQAAIDGFHESVEENNVNMRGAIKERERIVADCNVKLKSAREEVFAYEVRVDELACHRMFLMAQLNWYKKTFGPAKATVNVNVSAQGTSDQ
jgi:chromosome segregation ATPase